jgi:hypothetical protein
MNARDRASMRSMLLVGAAAFFVTGLVFAPASLIKLALENLGVPVAYERVDGTLWHGRIKHFTVGDQFHGDATFAVKPLHLLMGRLVANIAVKGEAGEGGGRVAMGIMGRSLRVDNAEIVFDLKSIGQYTFFGLPYQGELRASVSRMAWDKSGCRIAEAEIWTNFLDAPLRQFVGEGMDLTGAAKCDGEKLKISLNGANSEGAIDVDVALSADLTYELLALVEAKDKALENNLMGLGFEDNGSRLVYDAIGAIKGLGS